MKHRSQKGPFHITFLKKDDDDPRRDKRRCEFYNKENCNFRDCNCMGSAHCPYYKENIFSELKKLVINNNSSLTNKNNISELKLSNLSNKFIKIYKVYHQENNSIENYYISSIDLPLPCSAKRILPECDFAKKVSYANVEDVININGYESLIEKIENFEL